MWYNQYDYSDIDKETIDKVIKTKRVSYYHNYDKFYLTLELFLNVQKCNFSLTLIPNFPKAARSEIALVSCRL